MVVPRGHKEETDGGQGGGRYRKRAAVMRGRHRKRPLQEAGGGRDGGRHTNNALKQDASTTGDGGS